MRHSENYKHPKTALSGIMQYLSSNKYWRFKGTQFYDPMRELNRIILGFFKHAEIETKGIMRSKKMIALNPAAAIIRQRFNEFVEYLKTIEKL